jgi:hypothetical protein
MQKGRRKKKRFRNEMDDMEKGYDNDMYGSDNFDQIENKVQIYRHKEGPKRNRRACGIVGRNHRSGTTEIIEVAQMNSLNFFC